MRLLLAGLMLIPNLVAASSELSTNLWSARWITVPGTSYYDYGVYHFRRAFDLAQKPERFVVHVTADNRYQLYVNGQRASWGPPRGDLHHWRYDTVDIAPFLRPGRNVLAAVVWNFAEYAPVSQVTNQTGFLLQGDTKPERIADTGASWRCIRNEAYSPLTVERGHVSGYYVVGPGDRVDGARYPWRWEQPDYDDSGWKPARVGDPGSPRETGQDGHNRWMLVPRPIPAMEEAVERLASVRRASGVTVPAGFPRQAAPFQVGARTKATLLFDQSHLTTAYPELLVSGGKGASVLLRYAEKLRQAGQRDPGNRNDIEGKQLFGNHDIFLADGGARRLFRPLFWRTYRYLEMTIETAGEPLTIEDFRGVYTGYPFVREARFDAGSQELQSILDVGWRTARLCAHDTYMDCPYYEQLQYGGDTRIQGLVSMFMGGDGRLLRNAIEQLDNTRSGDAPVYCRAPSHLQLYIPSFSLWWIGMVHDYWMYQDEPEFVKRMLPGVRATLSFFEARQKSNGSLGPLPWWNYVDWVRSWPRGAPPSDEGRGSSAVFDLQLLLAYQWAARMEEALGSKALAGEYRQSASRLTKAIPSLYFDSSRRMYRDNPGRTSFSQHANALAILAGVVPPAEARTLADKLLDDSSLVQASIYFRYYVHHALNLAGGGDRYLDTLGPYRTMLAGGLTTWTESGGLAARSDCHAWGSQPNIELFRTVLGIDSAAPGFRRVVIRPFLGKLTRASGTIPHPKGEIAVTLERRGEKLEAEVSLPPAIEGEFVWKGSRRPLPPGRTKLVF